MTHSTTSIEAGPNSYLAEWERILIRVVARSPVPYVVPWRTLREEMSADVGVTAFDHDYPIVILPGTLHAAVGREVQRRYRLESWVRSNFEGGESAVASAILEMPELDCDRSGRCLLKAGRKIEGAWNTPNSTIVYLTGEEFSFGIQVRIARATEEVRKAVIEAFARCTERAGCFGVGGALYGERARFDLRGAAWHEQSPLNSVAVEGDVTLVFQTPALLSFKKRPSPSARLGWEQKMIEAPRFPDVWEACLNRLRGLGVHFSEEEIFLSRAWASQIWCSAADLGIQTWRDHYVPSTLSPGPRPHKALFLSGVVGAIRFEGPIGTFVPWLEVAGRLGIGDRTPLGLGRFIVAESG